MASGPWRCVKNPCSSVFICSQNTNSFNQDKTMIANLLKNSLPKISETEWQALEAGTVWIDGEYFLSLIHISEPTRPY